MKVIFNADDFGYSRGVNLGILEAYLRGPVRSATLMAGMPGFAHAVELAWAHPGLKVGAHLTLSTGRSVGGAYRTLTDETGRFPPLAEVERRARSGETDLCEVEAEYEAQIQRILASGLSPDHLDSHHHCQSLPGIASVFLRLAGKYGLAARSYGPAPLTGAHAEVLTTEAFDGTFHGRGATVSRLKRILSSHREASLEIMCHPGYVDAPLYASSSYSVRRACELEVLTSPETAALLARLGLRPCSFSEL